MKIVGLQIENFKRIEFVNLELDEHMNIVSGRNGAGKTSLVEALMGAIGGKTEMGKNPQRKIKDGADKAVVEVTLSDGKRTLNIKRTITGKDVYLKATSNDGTPVKQSDLDLIFDHTTINLMKLLHMNVKEQVEFMKRVGGINTDQVEEDYKAKFAERTVLNRDLKEKKSILASIGDVEEVKRVDSSEIIVKLNEISEFNSTVDGSILNHSKSEMELDRAIDARARALEGIVALEKEIASLKEQQFLYDKKVDELSAIEKEMKSAVKQKRDDSELRRDLENVEETNKKASEYERYTEAVESHDAQHNKVNVVNNAMIHLLKQRDNMIANSKLPFKNVSFDKERGVVIENIAFDDMSSAQQIRIMARIYIESNPGLKVIYIKDGSLLDPETLQAISEMSELKDYQFLVEIVNEQDESIVMRDGGVLGADIVEDDEREEV